MEKLSFRVLNYNDRFQIGEVLSSRTNMMIVSKNKLDVDGYRTWIEPSDSEAWDSNKVVFFGVFNYDELVGFTMNKIWTEIPLDKFYTISIFTKKTTYKHERYDNGATIIRTELMNNTLKYMESIGFYVSYNVRSDDESWEKTASEVNKYSRVYQLYETNKFDTIPVGRQHENPLFRKYLVSRTYDIPLIIYRYFLPYDKR